MLFSFLSFLIAGILLRNFVAVINPTLFIIISIIPIVVSYIPAYKAVFTDSRYLKYFKQFSFVASIALIHETGTTIELSSLHAAYSGNKYSRRRYYLFVPTCCQFARNDQAFV